MLAGEINRVNQSSQAYMRSISGFFIFLGLAALVILGYAIFNDPLINAAVNAEEPGFGKTLLAFMDSFGIVLPIIVIGLAAYLIRLGIKISQRHISAATWGRQVSLWLVVICIYFVLQGLFGVFSGANSNALLLVAVFAVIGGAAFATMQWLGNNEQLFVGQESLSSRNSRIAWNLLIPTILVLIIVALRPLEQTFIASLTDRVFASNEEVNFVGLDNYARLLGVRLDIIPRCTADGTIAGCPDQLDTDENGNVVSTYPRPRDYLGDSYRDLRYREVNEIDIFGTRLIVSARDQDFMKAVGNTLTFSVLSVTLELILGLFIAMVVNSKFAGRGLLRTAMLVPWAIPTVVSARLWEIMFRDNQSGVINSVLMGTGITDQAIAWLSNTDFQLIALVMVDVWKTTPFMALILLAGLQVIPSDIYEAADVDGASKVRQFFSITLPLLRPTMAVALVFRTLDAIRVFDVFQVLLERRQLSMATYNYEQLIQSRQFGYASTVGVVIFLIILIFTMIYVRALGVNNND